MLNTSIVIPDISFWQDIDSTTRSVDFTQMAIAGAPGVTMRMGQGSWIDEDFRTFSIGAKAAKLVRSGYWFLDSRTSPEKQADLCFSLWREQPLEGEVWADFEGTKLSRPTWEHLYRFITRLTVLGIPNNRIGVYTGFPYWTQNGPNPTSEKKNLLWFKQYPLWLAWYTEDSSKVKVPAPWTTPLLWQFTAKGDGQLYGVESKSVDLSYYQGTWKDYQQRYGAVPALPQNPNLCPKCGKPLVDHRCPPYGESDIDSNWPYSATRTTP
jgi:GH25 family lysozyme M1 (1,4-beta-N-acetylmuramidase)